MVTSDKLTMNDAHFHYFGQTAHRACARQRATPQWPVRDDLEEHKA